MSQEDTKKLDADYVVHNLNPYSPMDINITRTPHENTGEPELFSRYTEGVSILATEFKLNEGLETSYGWRIEREAFRERAGSHQDPVEWYYEGKRVEFENGKPVLPPDDLLIKFVHTKPTTNRTRVLQASGSLINGQTMGVLGIGDFKSTSGAVTIRAESAGRPAALDIRNENGEFSLHVYLGPEDFENAVFLVRQTGRLHIQVEDLGEKPLLVRCMGRGTYNSDFYWVPFLEPFKELYERLEAESGDGKYWHPSVRLYSGPQYIKAPSDAP